MVPAEPPPKTSHFVTTNENMDWRNISQLKSVNVLRPKTHDVNANSKVQLAPPLTKKAHRILTNKTEALMCERDGFDKVLLNQASRPLQNLRATDWLPRETILRQCEHLDRKERRHIRTRTKALEELTRRYESDPSAERAVDLDLVRGLLQKFQRHLGHELVAAEKPKDDDDDDDDDASSAGSDSKGDEAGVEVASSLPRDKDHEHTSEDDRSDEGSADQKPSQTSGLDGAFDDTRMSKKRKQDDLVESGKGPQKKTRKEQIASDTQASALKSQPEETVAPQRSQVMEDSIAAIKAEIDSMPQHKKTPKQKTSNIESSDRRTKETSTGKTLSENGSAEPFYKQYAKDMMRPDFNDHVHDDTRRRRRNFKKPTRDYVVHGAIDASHFLNQKRPVQSGKARPRNRRP